MLTSTCLCFATGLVASAIARKPSQPVLVGLAGTFTLFYAGSLSEFDRLVTMRPVRKDGIGHWLLCGGVMSAGLVSGGIVRGIYGCARRQVVSKGK